MSSFLSISETAFYRSIPDRKKRRRDSPALLGMVLALAVLAREPVRICIRKFFRAGPRKSPAEQAARLLSLPSLQAAIIGHGKQYITDMFGPPPTTSPGQCPVWYYPVSTTDRMAMAISFHDGRAVIVEFFQSPEV